MDINLTIANNNNNNSDSQTVGQLELLLGARETATSEPGLSIGESLDSS